MRQFGPPCPPIRPLLALCHWPHDTLERVTLKRITDSGRARVDEDQVESRGQLGTGNYEQIHSDHSNRRCNGGMGSTLFGSTAQPETERATRNELDREKPAANANPVADARGIPLPLRGERLLLGDHLGAGHGVFGLGDVLLFLSPRPGSLIGDAERGEVERVIRLQFARLFSMLDGKIVLARLGIDPREREMGENEGIVLVNDLSQAGDCFVELLFVDQLLDFVVPRVNIAHQKGL